MASDGSIAKVLFYDIVRQMADPLACRNKLNQRLKLL